MASHYFVYYEVKQPVSPDATARVAALLEVVAQRTGVRGRLVRKRDDGITWMEVYEGITDPHAFETLLSNAVADSTVSGLIVGARHVECFED